MVKAGYLKYKEEFMLEDPFQIDYILKFTEEGRDYINKPSLLMKAKRFFAN